VPELTTASDAPSTLAQQTRNAIRSRLVRALPGTQSTETVRTREQRSDVVSK
jgi:hypothetical protein